jgi:phosphoglycerate kinase
MVVKTLDDMELAGKRVLVRVDLNVPVKDGRITDATRIDRVLPTIGEISRKGGKAILLAHFGRPKGRVVAEMSLRPIAGELAGKLGKNVTFASDCVGLGAGQAVSAMNDGDILLLENTRFHVGEEQNDPEFAAALAENGDIFVNDAFSAAHRAHASTEGIAHLLPSCAGRALQAELEALQAGLGKPARPLAAVVGGAKVSTKIDLLENLVGHVDTLVIGGGMANTFLLAQGKRIGKSLSEAGLIDTATRILDRARVTGCKVVLPVDVVVAEKFEENTPSTTRGADDVPANAMILDVGPQTVAAVCEVFANSRTLVWNGPLGAFEIAPFDAATVATARAAARLTKAGALFSVAGGGDTVAALNHAGVADDFNYLSTAGGAFLEWLEGKELPGIAVLAQ